MKKSLSLPKLSLGRKPASRKPAPAKPKVSLRQQIQSVQRQFQGLDPNDPSKWPPLPRVAAWVAAGLVGMGLVWLALVRDQSTALSDARDTELSLREEYRGKLVQAVNIESLQVQKRQVEDFVQQLEKQLPSKAEMAALLSDINQAGMSQGLKFELFRPGAEVVRDYYAELPIAIRVTGKYGQVGHFASELANLSRIVTLEGITLTPLPDSAARKGDASNPDLVMDATARTYRYLDAAEIVAQRDLKNGNKTGANK